MNARRASLIIQNVNVSTKYLLKADVETREHNYEVFKVWKNIYIYKNIFFYYFAPNSKRTCTNKVNMHINFSEYIFFLNAEKKLFLKAYNDIFY